MESFNDLIAKAKRRHGELELFVEFPVDFGGETQFLSFTGDDGANALEGNDPSAIEFLTGAVSGVSPIAPRGFPSDASEAATNAIDVFSGELLGTPSFSTLADVSLLLAHHRIHETDLNPLLQCAISALRILTSNYGPSCRLVYSRHES